MSRIKERLIDSAVQIESQDPDSITYQHTAIDVSPVIAKTRFVEATFTAADLRGATFTAATLTAADLRGATFTAATLTAADLSGADLRETNLRAADLHWADLTEADLNGANVTKAEIFGCKGLEMAKTIIRIALAEHITVKDLNLFLRGVHSIYSD